MSEERISELADAIAAALVARALHSSASCAPRPPLDLPGSHKLSLTRRIEPEQLICNDHHRPLSSNPPQR